MRRVDKIVIAGLVAWLIFLFYINEYRAYDTTDDESARARSGMHLFIDYGTGCQYIAAGTWGALTPRMDKNGKQVCDEEH